MSTILEANRIGKYYSSEPTLAGISFKLSAGEKVGLVGENGCGKSTLLKLIAGIENLTEGHLTSPHDTRIGYLAQELHYTEGNSVYEELLDVFADLRQLEQKLAEMQHGMATAAGSAQQQLLDEYGPLAAEYEERGGYTYTHQIETIMT
jgi:ATP-binding cassette subfamily F protein 3